MTTSLAKTAEPFAGEEPILLPFREALDWMRSELMEIHANLKARHLQDVELPGPGETMLDAMRGTVGWQANGEHGPEVSTNIDLVDIIRSEIAKPAPPRIDRPH